ncbi:MAG: hypothetical protein HW383_857 [Candidatus Magasanikbacteria bacterium]|nr:hypothetical protein [Candidatus Magasanikbacteria bacterium]
MTRRAHILAIIALSAVMVIFIQFNQTVAILTGGYLKTPWIIPESNDESYYLPLVNESAKGNTNLGNPFIKEHAQDRFLYPALNINTVGFIKRLFSLDVKTLSVILDYVMVLIISVLVFALFLTRFAWRPFGYFAGVVYLLIPRMFVFLKRPVSPQINFLPLLAFLIFYFSKKISFWKREIGLAAFTAVMFYTYPYHWTFALTLLGLTDLWSFIKARRIIWRQLVKYVLMAVGASYYFYNLFLITKLSYYHESMRRIGALYNRLPAGFFTHILLILLLIGIFFLARFIRRKRPELVHRLGFFEPAILGLAASSIVLNQQFITGMQLEFNSHYLPVVLIFATDAFVGIIDLARAAGEKLKMFAIAAAIVVLIVLIGADFNTLRENPFKREHFYPSADLQVVGWFRESRITDKVIYAPRDLNDLINLYTGNYLSFALNERLQLASTAEILDRWIYHDLGDGQATAGLMKYQNEVFGNFYTAKMQKDNVVHEALAFITGKKFIPATPEQYVKFDFGPIRRQRENATSEIFNSYLQKYNVDYVVYRVNDRPDIFGLVPGDIVFQSEKYIIKKRK